MLIGQDGTEVGESLKQSDYPEVASEEGGEPKVIEKKVHSQQFTYGQDSSKDLCSSNSEDDMRNSRPLQKPPKDESSDMAEPADVPNWL